MWESLDTCWVKIHFSKTGEIVVAICDSELLGRQLRIRGGHTVKVDKAFYGGVQVPVDELDKYISKATIINMLGERCVGYALKTGLVPTNTVMNVDGIPHIQVYL